MAKKNKMSLFGGARGGKSDYPKSCSKLKKRKTPQGLDRVCNLHPQNIEVMHPTEQEQQDTNK